MEPLKFYCIIWLGLIGQLGQGAQGYTLGTLVCSRRVQLVAGVSTTSNLSQRNLCCGGDGCGFIVQKRMADWVDGKQVLIEGEPLVSYSVIMKFKRTG